MHKQEQLVHASLIVYLLASTLSKTHEKGKTAYIFRRLSTIAINNYIHLCGYLQAKRRSYENEGPFLWCNLTYDNVPL